MTANLATPKTQHPTPKTPSSGRSNPIHSESARAQDHAVRRNTHLYAPGTTFHHEKRGQHAVPFPQDASPPAPVRHLRLRPPTPRRPAPDHGGLEALPSAPPEPRPASAGR